MDVGSRVYYIDEGPEDTGIVLDVRRYDDKLSEFQIYFDSDDAAPVIDDNWFLASQLKEI